MVTIDGNSISGVTIDGTDVQEITIDGQTAWKATTIVDDFEDGDISEYGGDTGPFSVQGSVVKNGSRALEFTNNTNENIMTDTDNFSHPSQGDTFSAYLRTTSGSEGARGMLFGVQSETSRSNLSAYMVQLVYNGAFRIVKYYNGNKTIMKKTTPGWSSDTWQKVVVDWGTDGTITATVYENDNQKEQISTTDNTFSSGGIGWYGNRGNSSQSNYYDYYRIE
jgi:hypothetical protein